MRVPQAVKGIRTLDLILTMDALYQLSYNGVMAGFPKTLWTEAGYFTSPLRS